MTEHVEQSRWVERSGRFGLATKGVAYLLVAIVALKVVVGGGGQTEDYGLFCIAQARYRDV